MKIRVITVVILSLLVCVPVNGQEKSRKKTVMTGKVINRNSVPIKDVMIFLDGKYIPNSTNRSGEFKIKVKAGVEKIAFYSFNEGGYELNYLGQEVVEIIINPDFPMLTITPSEDGQTVETGYAIFKRDELTGTVSSIKAKRFENNSYKNIYDMIAGEVPGVTVVGTDIRIRGLSSFNMSNQPLFVVNGTPVSSIGHISPNDVASIDILKGPQTAMYGSRGSTGVIIIKLKSGDNR